MMVLIEDIFKRRGIEYNYWKICVKNLYILIINTKNLKIKYIKKFNEPIPVIKNKKIFGLITFRKMR